VTSGRDERNSVQQSQDMVGKTDGFSSDTEEETLKEGNRFILSQVKYCIMIN
jgi:hypothetical protein